MWGVEFDIGGGYWGNVPTVEIRILAGEGGEIDVVRVDGSGGGMHDFRIIFNFLWVLGGWVG